MTKDQIAIIKSASVKLSDGNVMVTLFTYHSEKEDKSQNFYRCDTRVMSQEDWGKLAAKLEDDGVKTQEFKTESAGFKFPKNYSVFYAKKAMANENFAKFIRIKMGKTISRKAFEDTAFLGKEPYLREYEKDGVKKDIFEIRPEDGWMTAVKAKSRNIGQGGRGHDRINPFNHVPGNGRKEFED